MGASHERVYLVLVEQFVQDRPQRLHKVLNRECRLGAVATMATVVTDAGTPAAGPAATRFDVYSTYPILFAHPGKAIAVVNGIG